MNILENNSLFNLSTKNDRKEKIEIMMRIILKVKMFKYSNSLARRYEESIRIRIEIMIKIQLKILSE